MNTLSPVARILRTLLQIAIAFPILVPTIVAALSAAGVESVDEAGLLAVAAAALAGVVALQNFLEKAGIIPTVGAPTAPEPYVPPAPPIVDQPFDPEGPHGANPERRA